MTPRMLVFAAKRRLEVDEAMMRAEEHRIGTLAAAIYTAHGVTRRTGGKKPWTPADFFGSLAKPEESDQPVDDQLRAMEAWTAAFGGRDLRGVRP